MLSDQKQILTVAGFSMEPLLRNGDRVTLKPIGISKIVPGDIVSFEGTAGGLVVHRVRAVVPHLITQGDNNLKPDPQLLPDTVLAGLTEVERGGTVFVPEQGKAGLKVFNRRQRQVKIFKLVERFGRFICRMLPAKVGEEQLQTVEFNDTIVYYWRDRAIGTYWKGQWRFLWWPAAFFIRRPRKIRPIPLAGLLSAIAAGHGEEKAAALRPELLFNCCETGRKFGFGPFIYYALSEVLEPSLKEQFQREYYAGCAMEIPRRQAMELIAGKLSERKIPFLWLKGGFLAYNVYPAACTRYMRDLDFLVRREDAETVFALLIEYGWVPREKDMRRKRSLFYRQHLPSLSHEIFPPVELHWHIFKDISRDSAELWKYARPSGNGSEYHFIPEIHYILIVYNCYIDAWEYGLRSMLDLELIHKNFLLDPELLQKLNSDFNLKLDLGLAYAAFPEFFNEKEKLFNSKLPPELIVAIRSLALNKKRNSVRSSLVSGNWLINVLNKLRGRIPRKLRRHLLRRDRVLKRDRLILKNKLPRFSDLRQEARRSHIHTHQDFDTGTDKSKSS